MPGNSVGRVDYQADAVRAAAQQYRSVGVSIVRLPPGDKRPVNAGWPTRSAEPGEFRPGEDIGIVCGPRPDGEAPGRFLVCVDLDSDEAVRLADQYLPATGAIEGRPGKPRSHRWYVVTGPIPDEAVARTGQAVEAAKEKGVCPGPRTRHFGHTETGKGVLDFKATGSQAVAPPSRHSSGETREWEPGHGLEHAAVVPFVELWAAVCRLAEAAGAKAPGGERKEPKTRLKTRPKAGPKTRPVDGTGLPPIHERIERCQRYLETVDLARSGFGGHNTTYRFARLIVNDFAVDDRELGLALLRGYNESLRAAGEEPWDEAEIGHKLGDALAAEEDPRWPRGCKLDWKPAACNNPARLADEFLAEHTLRFVQDTAFDFDGTTYRVVSHDWLSAQVRGFCGAQAGREYDRRAVRWRARHDGLRARLDELPAEGAGVAELDEINALKQLRAEIQKARPGGVPPVKTSLVSNVIEALRARCQIENGTSLDRWLTEPRPAVITVANGLLDPATRELHPHSPDWFSTTALPVAFDPAAQVPGVWLAFLNEVMQQDTERVAVVQEVFGACLDRTLRAKWFGALVGAGDNGKSVVLAVLRSVLGEQNCASVNLDELATNRFAAFGLFGKLANVIGDQGFLESADEGRLKGLTGGDLVTFEQKGRDPFFAVNQCKIVFACNVLPTFGDKSDAVWNRLVAVPFDYTVPAGKKDPKLLDPATWVGELPGVLNWALDGLARLRERGSFTRSAACDALEQQHRLDSNPAREFLLERYEITGHDADQVPVDDMYQAYLDWCRTNGYTKPVTATKFGRRVDEVFPLLNRLAAH
jgi:putative DNA primase/helicase